MGTSPRLEAMANQIKSIRAVVFGSEEEVTAAPSCRILKWHRHHFSSLLSRIAVFITFDYHLGAQLTANRTGRGLIRVGRHHKEVVEYKVKSY